MANANGGTRCLVERAISDQCLSLNKINRMTVLNWLQNQHLKISSGSDGVRVNLSTMSLPMLTQLHKLVTSLVAVEGLMMLKL
jgi:hypothetical protein